MPKHPPGTTIESIEKEMSFQRKEWLVQRVGWIVLFHIVIAALFGLTGKGSIINLDEITTYSADGSFAVKHEKFFRREADDKLTFIVENHRTSRELSISAAETFVRDVHIERIIPEPESQSITSFGVQYKFRVSDLKPYTEIYFYFKPIKAGNITVSFMAPSGSQGSFQSFVYP